MVDSPRLVFIHIFIEEIFKVRWEVIKWRYLELWSLTVIVDWVIFWIYETVGVSLCFTGLLAPPLITGNAKIKKLFKSEDK